MSQINTAVVLSVKRLREKGQTINQIADRHGLTPQQVKDILSGRIVAVSA